MEKLTASVNLQRRRLKMFLVVTSTIFLIVTLAGPQIGTKMVQVHRRGLDIIIAIDTSLSMQAQDIKPNRLKKAKMELTDFIDKLNGDRIGIIAFAGKAFLECPLTLDYNAAKMFLGMINKNTIPFSGTSIGDAIRLAIKSFSRKERKHKVLILLTDGEDHRSRPLDAATEAKKEGIRIYTIGIGTPDGEPIPIYDKNGNISDYKKDKKGATVMSKLDEMTLQNISLYTDGKYYHASASGIEVDRIYKDISGMEKKELKSRLYSQYEDRFQYFLLIAIVLLLWEMFLPDYRKKSDNENQ
jgi:Ca-activated chloride channel family protein